MAIGVDVFFAQNNVITSYGDVLDEFYYLKKGRSIATQCSQRGDKLVRKR
ncbi:hypothetical protein UNSWDHB_1506 [Dehalobacter sp. UNSWDHB]|nr:hypothetical protein DHBDCA_p2124 [Dehalobacter sp. DCA]AFV06141.1 hypothetical protein DCF50_p2138 [Dehalobacter sp. CF]EQB21118.1 hypothetical protein UNSWDHB_1506 [Dehalobacter sp. UNSWDHB]